MENGKKYWKNAENGVNYAKKLHQLTEGILFKALKLKVRYCQLIGINPVKILVVPSCARNVHVHCKTEVTVVPHFDFQ